MTAAVTAALAVALAIAWVGAPSGLAVAVVAAQPDLDSLARAAHGDEGGCRDGLGVLRSLASGAQVRARRAAFLLGWCLERLGYHPEAAAAYRDAAAHPTLAPHARVREARALLRAGRTDDAAVAAEEAVRAAAAAGRRTRARALAAAAMARVAVGRALEALPLLDEAARLRPDVPEHWLALGEAAAAARRTNLARRALASAAWMHPGHGLAQPAREAFARVAGRPLLPDDAPPEARLARGRHLQRQGQWDAAAEEFLAAARASRPEVAGEAWYRLGELRLWRGARDAYDAFARAAQAGWNQPGAYYWMAVAARRLGHARAAREAAAALFRTAPHSRFAALAWLWVGLRAEDQGRTADAASAYRRAAAALPDSHEAAEARWRLGWIALRAGRLADAEARFRAAAAAAPSRGEAARAWYWAARAVEAGGGDAGPLLRVAAERYPLAYYGQRARERLGQGAPQLPPTIPRAAPGAAAAPAHEELARLGFDEEAAEAAEDALEARRDLRVVRFLAEVCARLGDVRRSVSFAEQALGEGVRDEAVWRLAYPRAFWREATAAAAAAGVDPLLLLALVREESRYDPAAVSPARAVGLTQLLPSTAQTIASDATIGVARLTDPALNLTLGARYLRAQLDRFNGDLRLALAAYNAGPGHARRWAGLDADPDYLMESIGFAETRAYVRRVLGAYGIYRLLWGSR
ncbi:MAG: lytic transglycosylase domain-containing protein [Armatimonadota bacterium]|nr:lytic transglycosylase domain-containing protein [Armatimonadota bacterium]MDR7533624.1 lytic transglycosylase domain-containing protein [Armatimonadota bacterium]MDR7537342.1 lytic transglycosylase domain-containing protein [Armatimonadota bacterium]